MKKLLFGLALISGITCVGLTQTPATEPQILKPPYPQGAVEARVSGSGICRVVFDASGHVGKAVMIKSTGSAILDENTIRYAKTNWTGQPHDSLKVPITYQILKRAEFRAPPYPFEAIIDHVEGSGSVKVTFDATGKAIDAEMDRSTGSAILDDHTIRFALANWRIASGKKETRSVPIAYRFLRQR